MAAYMAANMGLDAAVKNLPDAAVKNLPVDHKHAAQQEPQKQQELHKEQELQKQQKRQQQSKHQMNKQDQQQEQHQGEEQQEQHPHKPSELELAKADFEKSNKRFTEVVVGVGETIGKNMWNHAVWWSQGVAGIVMFVPMMFWSLGQSAHEATKRQESTTQKTHHREQDPTNATQTPKPWGAQVERTN